MPIEFQQTDTNAPFGAIAACSGLSAGTTVDAGLCEVGGTPGSTELVADHPGSGSGTLRLIHFELDVADGTDWDAGNWTVRMGVTTQSAQLIWDSVFICRVDSGGTSQETIASATGLGIKFNLANVSHTLAGSAQTPNAGDRVYIVIGCTNNQTMSNTVGITPSDIITAPFTAGGGGTQDITPSAVTVNATAGTVTVAAGAVDITPDPVTVTATPGTVTVAPGTAAITPAPVTVTATPGTVTVATSGGGAIADDFDAYTGGNTLDSESADWAVWAASGTGVMTLDQHDDHSDLSQVVDMSSTGDNWAIHQTQVGGNDHYAEVDVFLDSLDEANNSLTAVAGPIVRGSQPNMGDSDFNGYAAFLERDDNGLSTATVILRIYRIDNDVPTLLASSVDVAGETYDASTTTATVRLEVEGNALTAYADGNELVSTTDSTHSTGQHCGMRLNRVLSATNGQPFVDNFAGDVLAGGGGLAITPAPVTVNATPGTLSVAAGAVDITPAAVTVQATPGALSVALNVALDAPTVTATPGSLTVTTGVVDITPEPTTVTATPGTVNVSTGAGTQDITPGSVTVTATPGTLSLAVDIVPEPVTITATPGALTVASGAVDVTPEPVTVTATPGTLTVTSGATGITPEPVTVTASPGSLTVTTGAVDITPVPATITATPGTLTVTAGGLVLDAPTVTATPGTLTLTTGAVDITPDPVTVTATPGTLDVGLAVEVDGPTVTATPGSLSIAVGATSITPAPVTVTATPGVMVLTGGQTADLNPIKLSFREPSRHLTHRESRHVTYQEG